MGKLFTTLQEICIASMWIFYLLYLACEYILFYNIKENGERSPNAL